MSKLYIVYVAYAGYKSMGRKVGFAAAFTHIPRRGVLLEEAFIHTVETTAIKVSLKKIHKREDKSWII